MKKFIIAAALLTAIIVGGTGCMIKMRPSFRERALAYMEDKYGEPFTFVSHWGSGYADKGRQMILVRCNSVPGTILVEGSRNGTENDFRDNYLAQKYSGEVTATVQAITEKVFGGGWVHYEVLTQVLSAELGVDATFREYCEDPRAVINLSVAVPAGSFDAALVQRYAEAIRETGIHGSIRFVAVEEARLSGLTIQGFNDILRLKSYGYYAVVIVKPEEISIRPREVGAT